MIRIIVGALLAFFGLIAFAVEIDTILKGGISEVVGFVLGGIFFASGVGIAGFGLLALIREKRVIEMALRQQREEQGIYPYRIGEALNISEVDVRKIILKAQKSKIIPGDEGILQ